MKGSKYRSSKDIRAENEVTSFKWRFKGVDKINGQLIDPDSSISQSSSDSGHSKTFPFQPPFLSPSCPSTSAYPFRNLIDFDSKRKEGRKEGRKEKSSRTRTLNASKGNGAHTIPAISRWKRVTALVKTIHNEHNILHATEEPRGAKRAAGKNVLSRQAGSFAPLKPASTKRGFHEKDGFTRKDSSSTVFHTRSLPLFFLLLVGWPLARRKYSEIAEEAERVSRYPPWDFAFLLAHRRLYTTRDTTVDLNKHVALRMREDVDWNQETQIYQSK